ncbi:MAG: metallophosphoesterase family protein [Promethearchaeota archaeon]
MVKFGIISDTHITSEDDPKKIIALLNQLREVFKDVDEIIHAGDVCEEFFLDELKKIAPIKIVIGKLDKIKNAEEFIKFNANVYNVGVIHKPPENMEDFFKKNNLHILIFGHTHIPLIKGTQYNTLILNPGSPTFPKPPPKKPMFKEPVARPSVMTLEIDESNILKTFIINLKI